MPSSASERPAYRVCGAYRGALGFLGGVAGRSYLDEYRASRKTLIVFALAEIYRTGKSRVHFVHRPLESEGTGEIVLPAVMA